MRPPPGGFRAGAPRRRQARARWSPAALSVAWLTLIVLIPLAAVVVRSLDGGVGEFWDAITAPQAVAAIRLTLVASVIVAAIDAVMGMLIAWVLVRDDFRGKRSSTR